MFPSSIRNFFFSSFPIYESTLDVASAFPLNGVTLGNNLMSSYYGTSFTMSNESESGEFKKRAIFRLLAAIPPVIAAAIVKDLGSITAYTGLTGILISLIVPAALSYASKYAFDVKNLNSKTEFTIPSIEGKPSLIIVFIGIVSIVYILHELITKGVPAVLT